MSLKILDYGKPNPFGEIIGRANRLIWPVHVYRLTLPKASNANEGRNPFERVILKLLDADGAIDAPSLADQTRIPLDLVKGILLRLRDKGLVNERYAIIEQKQDGGDSKAWKVPVFATALLFRELATGKLLPFLHLLDDSNPLQKRDNEKFDIRIHENPAYKHSVPSSQDVISVLRAMKKRLLAFGVDDRLPSVQQITIARSPESYYLECPIAVQKSDGEFRIADPFGNGFSRLLENAFSQLLEQDTQLCDWLLNWKQGLINPNPPKREGSEKRPKEPFETESNWQRYPKLVANLRHSENAACRSLSKIYASIEWAFFYACRCREFGDVIAKLKLTAPLEHSTLLERAARSVGLEPPLCGFRPILDGKLIGFQEGQAELGTVLAIGILQAERDETHPLRHIALSQRDFINRLFDIKRHRDETGHGKGNARSSDSELPAEAFMREIVHALVPDIRFADTPVAGMNREARADSMLDARASVQSEFGFRAYNRFGANLQNRLVHAERFWLASRDGEDALMLVCDLYAALQSIFRRKLSGTLPPDLSDSQFITAAATRSQGTGLGNLSECLRTVQPVRIRSTLQGRDETLGACVIAFLLVADEHTLIATANSQPTFIEDTSRIITLRGHGNEPLPLENEEIARLRRAAYLTITTLQEA